MWDFIGPGLATVGPWGLTILVVATVLTSVIRGWLVPARTVDRLERELLNRVSTAERRETEWREIAQLSDRRADTAADQTKELLRGFQTVERYILAVDVAAAQVRRETA